jgi:hypothetical protein
MIGVGFATLKSSEADAIAFGIIRGTPGRRVPC